MGATKDKIKGEANVAVGKAKQAVGDIAGDNKLKAKGTVQQAKGDVQKAVGNFKGALKKAAK